MQKKWKYIKVSLTIFIWIVSFMLMAKVVFLLYYPDFQIYYLAASRAMQGQDPYQLVPGIAAFIYPPIALFIFAPFTLFPLQIAGEIWTVLSIIFLLLSLGLIFKLLSPFLNKNHFLFLSSLVIISFPIKFSLGMGQVNMLVLCLVSTGLYCITQKRPRLAGFFLGLSLGIKFFPIFLIIYFLFKKNFQIVFSILLTIIITIILPYLVFSPQMVTSYWIVHFGDVLKSVPREYYNQSFASFWYRQFGMGGSAIMIRYIIAISWVGLLMNQLSRVKIKTKEVLFLEWSSVITLSILLSNIAWQHHYVLMFIPFLFLAGHIVKKRKWGLLALISISYLLVSSNLPQPYVFPLLLQSHVFLGGLLLWGVNFWLLKRYAL